MRYTLLIGTKDSGKSTTMDAINKTLNKRAVFYIYRDGNRKLNLKQVDNDEAIYNGTYLINHNGKMILLVAGAPTEQKITITEIILFLIALGVVIAFGLISMRSSERIVGFDTKAELDSFGYECVMEKVIEKIEGNDYQDKLEWKSRIEEISKVLKNNI